MPLSEPELFFLLELFLLEVEEDFFSEPVWVEVLEAPWPVVFDAVVEDVVDAVSVLFAQELKNTSVAAQITEVRIDFFIGL